MNNGEYQRKMVKLLTVIIIIELYISEVVTAVVLSI